MLQTIQHTPVSVRVATMADLPFIDALQKAHSKQLGFFPRQQMEEYIANGNVLVAESVERREWREESSEQSAPSSALSSNDSLLSSSSASLLARRPLPLITRLGYVASRDRYLKRDELGAIFQMCVAPGNQRKFVAATLLQAVFDRAPYGCRLYCCWCAQDIEANHFWEAMGFVPLAFRTGGKVRGRQSDEVTKRRSDEVEDDSAHSVTSSLRHSVTSARVHIFWQKRIRAGDTTTPYWFPSQTTGGAIGAGRIVLPIPPGTHWSDAMPIILPGSEERRELAEERLEPKRLPSSRTPKPGARSTKAPCRQITAGAFRFAAPAPPPTKQEKLPKPKPPRAKNDPKLIAAARELRDRWLEQVNSESRLPQRIAKYDLRKTLTDNPATIGALTAA
jgi:hypothetical protein